MLLEKFAGDKIRLKITATASQLQRSHIWPMVLFNRVYMSSRKCSCVGLPFVAFLGY